MVERQVQQLTRLVDDLLDVSRVAWRDQPPDGTRRPQGRGRAGGRAQPSADRARKHSCRFASAHAVDVDGDAGRLVQVVSNLLNNGARYSDDGGRIQLIVDAIGDQAVLRVRDTGIGIEPAMLPSIFDLFIQAKTSTTFG